MYKNLLFYWLAFAMITPLSAGADPSKIVLVTGDRTTLFYSVAGEVGRIIDGFTHRSLEVKSYKSIEGPQGYVQALDKGEGDFAPILSADGARIFRGTKVGGRNPFQRMKDLRIIMRGLSITGGLFVKKTSPARTVRDIKGMRVTGEYPDFLGAWDAIVGEMASANLTWKDVKIVPVAGLIDGPNEFLKGNADATEFAINSAKVAEADKVVGIKYLSATCDEAGKERITRAVPGYYSVWLKKGDAVGIVDDTCVLATDVYLATRKNESDDKVVGVLSALWTELSKKNRAASSLKGWSLERAVSPDVTVAYHPAAVKFFKEKGVWTEKMERAQKHLLQSR